MTVINYTFRVHFSSPRKQYGIVSVRIGGCGDTAWAESMLREHWSRRFRNRVIHTIYLARVD